MDSHLDDLIDRIQALTAEAATPALTPEPSLAAEVERSLRHSPSIARPTPPGEPNPAALAARQASSVASTDPHPGVRAPDPAETPRSPSPGSGPAPLRAPADTPPPASPAPPTTPGPIHATPAASDFQPCRDEPWRPAEPIDLDSSRISEAMLEAIILRFLLNAGEATGRRIADQVQLPFRMTEPILARFKNDHLVAHRGSTAANDYVFMLTEAGRMIARSHSTDSTYFGACPVRLTEYVESIRAQTIEGQFPKQQDLRRAFSDLLINQKMLERLGPAIASGRGMFLFGYPGNGKTSIAERVTGAFGKYIWIPRSIDIDGEILRVYDPMNHIACPPPKSKGLLNSAGYDRRWVRIERPTIVVGGELSMEMLEVMSNTASNISEAPLQMKSNCGTLVIDDFGRQKMSIDQLLNRWIVPLEKRFDYLNMTSGKKIQVPFDQLVIFSTNLEPKDLVDDAFLRRIPYKIEVQNPTESDFRKLFEIMCGVTRIPYNAEAVDYLIKTHYLPTNRPFRNCQPRDLLMQVRNYCLYNDYPIELKKEYLDFACENYFSVM